MIIKDYKTIYGDRKSLKLVYRKRHYKEDQDNYIRLQEKNRRASSKTIDGKKFYLTKIEEQPVKERIEQIYKILDETIDSGKTLAEEIESLWETKYCHKNQSDSLDDYCSRILESYADYILAGNEGDTILDTRRWELVKKYEVASLIEDMSSDVSDEEKTNKPSIETINKKARKKRDRQNIGQTKRWKNSTTCRMDKIYSYNNTKSEREFILGKYVDIKPRVAVKYDRKIDKSKPYLSSWETVDTDGFFLFNDKIFIVKDKQYKCNPLADKGFVQDKILCYMQDDKYYFYDMEIKELKEVREITTSTTHA